jgi:hypothetical protein
MNRIGAERLYLLFIALFLTALAVGCVIFLLGMREASYLVSDGVSYSLYYFNKPRYDSHLQGLIFTLAFFAAGLLLMLLIILPNSGEAVAVRRTAPPQPRQRPQPVAGAAAQPPPRTEPEAAPAAIAMTMAEQPAAAVPAPAPAPAAPARSLDEEVLSTSSADDLPVLDVSSSRLDDAGEDDVVYGTGRVTDDAIWEFIQNHPDSAVKFLYRKTLDNKPLSPADEDIYRKWEMRGMNRGLVRKIVMEIMSWKSLPDDFPHNIWRELRDQVFEMRSR